MKRVLIRTSLILSCIFVFAAAVGTGILFGTPYGYKLRTIAAESILTSQHPQYAKYTFLPESELEAIRESIYNPAWQNTGLDTDAMAAQDLAKRQQEPLSVTVETIEQKFDDHYFKGKLVTISNPLNVKLVTQQGTQGEDVGERINVMAERHRAIAAVNASGFWDETGHGGGKEANGIVIEDGQIKGTAGTPDSPALIAGLTQDGQMVTGSYSANQLVNMGVTSAAGFLPQLIVKGEKMITHGNGGWGYGPRTIMAQTKDGAVMFLVIDGRQAHSIGASLKDCQDLLYARGAYNALAMDGGSSSVLYTLGDIVTIPSTLSHKPRYLPNAWVVTARAGQEVSVTLDGETQSAEKIAEVTGTSATVQR